MGTGTGATLTCCLCLQHRTYHKFNSIGDQSFTEGITFYLPDGTQVVNYPKQHSSNLTLKHQNTHNLLKPTVRVLKNMRNKMITDGVLQEGRAPSYFIEGMMSNVPNGHFNFMSYQQTIAQSLYWIANSDHSKLTCANGIHWLARKGYVECWNPDHFTDYLGKALDYWNHWGS